MDYVHGESLLRLMRSAAGKIPPKITAAIVAGALHGLHAAHEACSEDGTPLGIVHRDVSPQNVIVGLDGVPRVLDFGVAKASDRLQTTQAGMVKGKLRYMPPEQVLGLGVTRQTDVYAMAIVLHEMLTGRPLFSKGEPTAIIHEILNTECRPPSAFRDTKDAYSDAFDAIVMRGLARNPSDRFRDAEEMAIALDEAIGLASANQVGSWVKSLAGDALSSRMSIVSKIEQSSSKLALGPDASDGLSEFGIFKPVDVVVDEAQVEAALVPSQVSFIVPAPPASTRSRVLPALAIAIAAVGILLFILVSKLRSNADSTTAHVTSAQVAPVTTIAPPAPPPEESAAPVTMPAPPVIPSAAASVAATTHGAVRHPKPKPAPVASIAPPTNPTSSPTVATPPPAEDGLERTRR